MKLRLITAVWGQFVLFAARLGWGIVKPTVIAAVLGCFVYYQARLRDCEVEGTCCCVGAVFLKPG